MDFYYFTSDFNLIRRLEVAGFEGVLFTYNASTSDHIVNIVKKTYPGTKIKHMVAIRPYTISPQYLSMISESIINLKNNTFQINLISGYIKDGEKNIGGIVGSVNDHSSQIERSEYLIEYIDSLEKLNRHIPDYYVSATNKFTFEAGKKHNSKMIISYKHYKDKVFDLNDQKIMVHIDAILRETKEEINALKEDLVNYKSNVEYLTYEEFNTIVDDMKNSNINQIMFSCFNPEDTESIIKFVKNYKIGELK
jgi:hypothetical protein